MTVADMTPAELYGLIFLAMFNIGGALYAVRLYPDLTTRREKFMFFAGMAGIVGLPLFFGVRLFSSLI